MTDASPRPLWRYVRPFLRFGSPRFLTAQLALAFALRLTLGPADARDLMIVLGVLVYWPLQEWAAHRWILHARPRRLFGAKLDPGRVHRDHHARPETLATAILPLRVVLAIAPAHLLLWWLITPDLARTLSGVTAFTAATLVYEWIHYLTHTDFRARGRYFSWIQRNHRMHHYRHERNWYSFTAPFLDTALGTGPHPREVARSPHCRDLGIARDD